MTRYASNNYFLFDKIMPVLVLIVICAILTLRTENSTVILAGIVILLLLSTLLIRLMSRLTSIDLTENGIIVNHLITRSQTTIAYHNILELQHQFRYPVFSRNRIKYQLGLGGKIKVLKFTSVVQNGEFNDFASWVKSKNSKIKFTFLPPDSPVEVAFKKFNK